MAPSLVSRVIGGVKKKEKDEEDGVWQDREIRFDTSLPQLAIRPGEFQIDSINSVEDTKGNNGEKGSLAITNLRLVWICHRNSRINLSIGYSAVQAINIKTANSRLRGNTQALYVMTKYNKSRFEFVFTNLVRQSPRLFTTVQAVYRAYDTSRLFRDLKLRGTRKPRPSHEGKRSYSMRDPRSTPCPWAFSYPLPSPLPLLSLHRGDHQGEESDHAP